MARRGNRLHPLVTAAIALAAVGVCLAGLSLEWDRRGRHGFGPRPAQAVAPATAESQAPAVGERPPAPARVAPTAPAIHVYFSPDGGATEAILRELDLAKRRVRVQAYSFTSAPIAKAVVDAKRRGVDVTVVLDSSQRGERYTSARS